MSEPAELPLDAPDADRAEQEQEVVPAEPPTGAPLPPEVDEYDAAEQSIVVELDEDEYR